LPIPMTSERARAESEEEMLELYKGYGWSRGLSFEWIDYDSDQKIAIKTHYELQPNAVSCNCQGGSQYVVHQIFSTGLMATCQRCRAWTGNISMELCRVIDSHTLSLADAVEYMKVISQRSPIGFPRVKKKSKLLGWV
jgi:hypothetical protein